MRVGGPPELIRPGLDRIRTALALSGRPDGAFRILHVAGTNGKGSVSCFAEAILRRLLPDPVGLYTSPHLLSPEERIRVSGVKISPRELRREMSRASEISRAVEGSVGDPLSWFEELTWIACDWFRRKAVRVAVMEAGLGGRWDATSACAPVVSVVTNVEIDHREWLGSTLTAIAHEKAGIFREGTPVVLGRLRPGARKVVAGTARKMGCPTWELGRDFGWESLPSGRIGIRLPGLPVGRVRVGMEGEFQKDNAAVACAAAWRVAGARGISDGAFREAARDALATARWPGRFSRIPGKGNGRAWADGAHNPAAGRALAAELSRLRSSGAFPRAVALWSMLGDKDIRGFVRAMSGAVDGWVAYGLSHERAAAPGALAAACRKEGVPFRAARDFPEGWEAARRWAGNRGIVVVCGSLMAVGDAWRHRVGDVP